MRPFSVKSASCVKGEITLLGDKSIAHRAVILSAIAPAKTQIENFPFNEDCLSTVEVFKKLGVKIILKSKKNQPAAIIVSGAGLSGLKRPEGRVFIGDSGTTLRVILGLLAGQNFKVTLQAGRSLSKRPMSRVTVPLRMMGARISARRLPAGEAGVVDNARFEEYPPITIKGGNLRGIDYKIPVASAQVKSAILLAGLYVKERTRVREQLKTRDHTERMLKLFRADLKIKNNEIFIRGAKPLVSPGRIYIPGDISSASFFIVLTLIKQGSRVLLRNIGLNPSRLGIVKVLKRMKADIQVKDCRLQGAGFEPMGDLLVKSSGLIGTVVKKEEIPSLIDELPILMVAACFAQGRTVFEGVGELRVKETDRIRSMLDNLKKMGADITTVKIRGSEKIIIRGVKVLTAARVKSFGDHRTAMSMVVAGLNAKGCTKIDDISCVNKSFPNFLEILKKIIK